MFCEREFAVEDGRVAGQPWIEEDGEPGCGGGVPREVALVVFCGEGEEEGRISVEIPDGQRHVGAAQEGWGVHIVSWIAGGGNDVSRSAARPNSEAES